MSPTVRPAAGPHVVVVGDVVLDRDVDGRVERLCPDAPAPVLDVEAVRESPGGAGLTALLCDVAGARVTLVAPIADDDAGRAIAAHLSGRVGLVAVGHEGPTRRKTRIRSAGQSLVRMDDGGPGAPRDVPAERLRELLDTADVVLVSDYGAGTTRDPAVREVLAEAARRRPVVWDPHPRGGAPVPGCALVTPNLGEAEAAAEAPGLAPDVLAERLLGEWDARGVCVTAGARGAFAALRGSAPIFVPAPRVTGGDPCGAGDRFASSAAVALARGATPSEAVSGAVGAASDWVALGGAEAFRAARSPEATPWDVAGSAPRPGAPSAPPAGTPVVVAADEPQSVERVAEALRARGGTLVATGGCFDIVHPGHVATLQAARALGDALVVLVNSDDSVRRLKGPQRPVVGAADRARVLAAFDCVDAVVVFEEDDPRQALSRLRPDVWAKGGDYGGMDLPESAVLREHGGRVVLLPYLSGHSTTSIIERTTGHAGPGARAGTFPATSTRPDDRPAPVGAVAGGHA